MHEEVNNEDRIPEFDFMAVLNQRIAEKKAQGTPTQSATGKAVVDPYQMMVKRRQQNAGEILADYPVQNWPEADVKKLSDFCQKMGILGFSAGNMNPIAALALLKQKLGIVDEFPKTEGYGPNYPYTEALKRRILLSG